MPRQRQVIALGGGGFSTNPENPAFDRYILRQTNVARPKVCFLATATGDSDRYIASFYSTYSQLDCLPSHVPFFQRTPDLRSAILSQDAIYVGGGNTKSMLAVWKDWRLDSILREAWETGIVMSGISAGAICWFQQGITDSFASELQVLECLGFLEGSCCPHYDGEADRRPAFHQMLLDNRILPGYALDDGAGLHFIETEIHRAIVARPTAQAYRMSTSDRAVDEHPLKSESLK